MNIHLEVLSREFQNRIGKNPRYSLRAYASFLGLHPSALSRIFAGKQDISLRAGLMIVKKLGLPQEEKRLFLQSVTETRRLRETSQLGHAIGSQNLAPKPFEISAEIFGRILNLTCLGLLELTFCDKFDSDPAVIAKRLGVDLEKVNQAISDLLSVGLLERDETGRLINTRAHMTAIKTTKTDEHRRRHQKEILERASASLEKDAFEIRGHYGMTMAVDAAKIQEANRRIKSFTEELCDFLAGGEKNEVYQLAIQLFPLTKTEKGV